MRAKSFLGLSLAAVMICTSGCGADKTNKKPSIQGGNEIAIMPTKKNTEESTKPKEINKAGVLVQMDLQAQTCMIQTLDSKEQLVYDYTGGTQVEDSYGTPILASNLQVGEIVQIIAEADTHKLTKMVISKDEWVLTDQTNFKLDQTAKTIEIGSRTFRYTDELVVCKDGQKYALDKLEVVDKLTLRGRDEKVDSIVVTGGHGYVKLMNTDFFEGGYVEIGQKIVKVITANMIIPVTPGTYLFQVSKDGVSGTQEITVEEDAETAMNLIEFQQEAVKMGSIEVKVNPADAKVKIDGKEVDISQIVQLSYGTHKLTVSKEGYDTYQATIQVGETLVPYNVTLIKSREQETSSTTQQETTSSQETTKESAQATTKQPETTKRSEETTTFNYESQWYGIVSDFLDD